MSRYARAAPYVWPYPYHMTCWQAWPHMAQRNREDRNEPIGIMRGWWPKA
jgi:hypothetical protein